MIIFNLLYSIFKPSEKELIILKPYMIWIYSIFLFLMNHSWKCIIISLYAIDDNLISSSENQKLILSMDIQLITTLYDKITNITINFAVNIVCYNCIGYATPFSECIVHIVFYYWLNVYISDYVAGIGLDTWRTT